MSVSHEKIKGFYINDIYIYILLLLYINDIKRS